MTFHFQCRHTITREGKVLQIRKATRADTARYSCVARNLAGEKEKVTDIAVQGMFFYDKRPHNRIQ